MLDNRLDIADNEVEWIYLATCTTYVCFTRCGSKIRTFGQNVMHRHNALLNTQSNKSEVLQIINPTKRSVLDGEGLSYQRYKIQAKLLRTSI